MCRNQQHRHTLNGQNRTSNILPNHTTADMYISTCVISRRPNELIGSKNAENQKTKKTTNQKTETQKKKRWY